MKKEILIIGIICLFIGVGIQPAFAIENIAINRPSKIIEDCGCEVTDNYDIVRVKSLLNRVESFLNRVEMRTKLITTFSKDNPEVFEVCLEYIEICQEKLETICLSIQSGKYELICSFLSDLWDFLWEFFFDFVDMLDKIAERFNILIPIFSIVILLFYVSLEIISTVITMLGGVFDCNWLYPDKYERIQQLRNHLQEIRMS